MARGMVADLTLHDPLPDESDARHFHAHVLLTLREAHGNGLSRVKTREWNSDALLMRWRQQWEVHANRALGSLPGIPPGLTIGLCWISATMPFSEGMSKAARSLDRLPQIAIGPEAVARHRRGVQYVPKHRPQRKRSSEEASETRRSASHRLRRTSGFADECPQGAGLCGVVPLSLGQD